MGEWHVYILRCADGTLYTGITTDLERRVEEHSSGGGARYTASRRPVELVYSEPAVDRSAASRREAAIKQLARADKLVLIEASGE
jgi:putative endonuclease